MLVISRKCHAEICIGPDITIKVLEIRKGQIKVGIDAPSQLSISARGTPPEHRSQAAPCREGTFRKESTAMSCEVAQVALVMVH